MPAAREPREAAIYVRVSQDRTGAGLAVDRQEADCRALAVQQRLIIPNQDAVYVDNDTSASTGRPREQYLRLLADVDAGRWPVVLVWHTDRLHRSPVELEAWIDAAERHGTAVRSVQSGHLDLATPSGRMVARMLGAAARYEIEHKRERQIAASNQAVAAGRLGGGGHRPFGYQRVPVLGSDGRVSASLLVIESEAAVIRECAERILAGEPLRAVTRDLTARGIATSSGKEWSAQTVRRMLSAGVLCGWRDHWRATEDTPTRPVVGERVAQGGWEPILTYDQTTLLRQRLLDPARRLTPQVSRRCLLSGILRCHGCGNTMSGRPKEDGQMRYVCPRVPGAPGRCGRTYILTDPTDEHIVAQVLIALDSPALVRTVAQRGEADPDTEALEHRIALDRERLLTLGKDLDDGVISRAEWLARKARIEERIEAGERERLGDENAARLRAVRALGPLAEQWPTLTLSQRRTVIDAVVERIVVGPGRRGYNRFDGQRLEIRWRY